MAELLMILTDKVPGDIYDDVNFTERRRYNFLARAYAILNTKAKKEDIINRFSYIKGVLNKMPIQD
jgi:hypothetical protein